MVYGAGLQLHDFGDRFGFGTLSLGPFKLLITMLITISVINAFNLVDGGFDDCPDCYRFDFPAAVNRGMQCFTGDTGSTLLGFIIVCVTVSISQWPERIVSRVIGLWFAAMPIYSGQCLHLLRLASEQLDRERVRDVLKEAVNGYQPANGIDDLVWARKHGVTKTEEYDDKVIDITTRRARFSGLRNGRRIYLT